MSPLLRGKGGLRARVLDSLLDDLLHFIPVTRVNPGDIRVEVVLDLHKHVPFLSVRYKRDGDANAAKATRTTNTVEVSLAIGHTFRGVGNVEFRNIL